MKSQVSFYIFVLCLTNLSLIPTRVQGATPQWAQICHEGKEQSPIDFTPSASLKKPLTQMKLSSTYFTPQKSFYITNTQHSVQVQLGKEMTSNLVVECDGKEGAYTFGQLHFHWGSNDSKGAEHLLAGKSHSMELHLVHYSSKFKTLVEAAHSNQDRALLVFGVWFKVGGKDSPALQPIIDSLTTTGINENLKLVKSDKSPLVISSLVPNGGPLFRYDGSLTTPTCSEVVYWNMFKNPMTISRKQIEALRRLKDQKGESLNDNNRATVALGGRKFDEHSKVVLVKKR